MGLLDMVEATVTVGVRQLCCLPTMKRGSDQRYKQIYLTQFYDQSKEHRLVGVTRQDHRGLGKLLKRDGSRVRLRGADERLGLVDGAVCLGQHLQGLSLQEVILDFRHLLAPTTASSPRSPLPMA